MDKIVDGKVVKDEAGNNVQETLPWERPECPVCIEAIEPSDDVYIRDACGHVFHKKCMEQLVNSRLSGRNQCPVCKQQLPQADISKLKYNKPWPGIVTCALEGNAAKMADILRTNPAALNEVNNNNETALIVAAKNGQSEIVRLLLKEPQIDFDKRWGSEKRNAFMLCASTKHVDTFREFLVLPHVYCNNSVDDKQNTPLMIAVCNKHVDVNTGKHFGTEMVEFYLEALDTIAESSETKNMVNAVREIIDEHDEYNTVTALMMAVKRGHHRIVDMLCRRVYCDKNEVDDGGGNALFTAIEENQNLCAYYLLKSKTIDINKKTYLGTTALMHAVRYKNLEVTRRILNLERNVVNLNSCNGNGCTALMIACTNEDSSFVEEILSDDIVNNQVIKRPVKLNLQDKRGYTALMFAVKLCLIGPVRTLLSTPELDVNITDKDGWSPLMISIQLGSLHVAKLLLTHPNIDLDIKEHKHGRTALDIAREASDQISERSILQLQEARANQSRKSPRRE